MFCVRRNLQKTVSDRGLLRHLTGEWFYATKQLRHQDRIHGTDIIRASMKQAPRTLATGEFLIWPALPSWVPTPAALALMLVSYVAAGLKQDFSENLPVVSSENEDVWIPPVARSNLQVTPGQHTNERRVQRSPLQVWSKYTLLF